MTALVVSVSIAFAASGCRGGDPPAAADVTIDRADSTDPAAIADANLPDPAEQASNGVVPEEPGFVQVDANTATVADLIDTFAANGLSVGEAVAAAVVDHRPYVPGDQSGGAFDDLRVALADEGLDEFTVEAVVASLTA